MIKFEYKPAQPDKTWGYAQDIPPVEELTMTLGDDVTWDEATKEFHNFLRAAGYVIPYDFEEEEKRSHEEFLQDLDDWAKDEGNTEVAHADESNTPVATVGEWGRIEWREGVFPNLGAKLYMSPQESEKTAWIPLKITERNRIIDEWHSLTNSVKATGDAQVTRLCKMIEAKLKELNT